MPEKSDPQEIPVPFVSRQRVHFDMLDALGMLHNAAYILLFERARTDFWLGHGLRFGDAGLDWPYFVVRNEINYHKAIWSDQEVDVNVGVAKLGRTSLTFRHAIYLADGTLAANGLTVIVRVDRETNRPIPWSGGFCAMIGPSLLEVGE